MSTSPPGLGSSLGVIELGILASTMLYGIMIVQAYTYYQAAFKDSYYMRSLVISVVVIESFHTFILWAYLYDITVSHFGNHNEFPKEKWTIRASFPITAVVTCLVQGFFAIRVYRLSGRIWFTILSWSLASVQLAAGIAISVLTQHFTITTFHEKYLWLMAISMTSTAIVDIGNTIALCACLAVVRSDAIARRSRGIVDKLILWTIETGLITSILVLIMLVMVALLPDDNFTFLFFFCVTTKLYSNSLLASLNNRISLRAREDRDDQPIQLSPMATAQTHRRPSDAVRVDVIETRLVEGAPFMSSPLANKVHLAGGTSFGSYDDKHSSFNSTF